jgi:hypothetical protein
MQPIILDRPIEDIIVENYLFSIDDPIYAEIFICACKIINGKYNDKSLRDQVISETYIILNQCLIANKIKEFVIVCDERNNPPTIIDDGKFGLDIYIKHTNTLTYSRKEFII